jgi:hypothetical protein
MPKLHKDAHSPKAKIQELRVYRKESGLFKGYCP